MVRDLVTTTIKIEKQQLKKVKDDELNLSKFVRRALNAHFES